MVSSIYATIASLLVRSFDIEPEQIAPTVMLGEFGFSALSLSDFLAALESRFSLRIPLDALTPRIAEVPLARVCEVVADLRGSSAG